MKTQRHEDRKRNSRCVALTISVYLAVSTLFAVPASQTLSDRDLAKIAFEQKLDSQITRDLRFVDETGAEGKLGDYFGQKPVILVLGYYECPMLCTLVLNGLIETLQEMKWSVGKEFDVVCVSINPNETPALAAAKKRTYLKRYGRAGAAQGWHFLTGREAAIKQLADEAGFRYAYDPVFKQYAHASGFVVLTPVGKVTRYFFGISHSPKELFGALQLASANKIGSPIQQLFFLCFHYNPIKGKYGAIIMTALRLLGAGTVVGIAWAIVMMVRTERKKQMPRCKGGDPAQHVGRQSSPFPLNGERAGVRGEANQRLQHFRA